MASVSDSFNNKEISNLPDQQHFLASLVNSFPKEWKGMLAALNSDVYPLQKASSWLEEQFSSMGVSDTFPHWPKLIDDLVAEFPVVVDNEVFFMPKILLLPLNMQRNLFGFIRYSNTIPLECLERLVCKVELCQQVEDGTSWKKALRELLKAEVRNKRLLDKVLGPQDLEMGMKQERMEPLVQMDILSSKSKQVFTELCEKIRNTDDAKVSTCSVYSGDYWVLQNDLQENSLKRPVQFEDGLKIPATCIVSPGLSEDKEVNMEEKSGRVEEGDVRETEDLEIFKVLEGPAKRLRKDLWDTEVDEPSICSVPCPPDELPESMITEITRNVTSLLSASLTADIEVMRDCIQTLQTSPDCQTSRLEDLSQAVKLFVSCTTIEMEEICIFLGLRGLSESISVLLCQQFLNLTSEPSYGNATIFARHLILPRLQELTEAASRVLTETVGLFAEKYPRAFCDGVIVHLLSSIYFAISQADVVSKVISDAFTTDVVKSMLEKLLNTRSYLEGPDFKWSEDVVTVVLGVINLKLDIFDKPLFEKYACMLEQQAVFMGKSLKFPKLVVATIGKYPALVRLHHDLFEGILHNNGTFFKKAGLAALKKVMK